VLTMTFSVAKDYTVLVAEFLSLRTFNAGSAVLDDQLEADHSHSYLRFSVGKYSAAMAS
jgi:hypothetical protein